MARQRASVADPPADPHEILAEAKGQLVEAQNLRAALEFAVRNGDDSVGPDDLADASKRVDWATLRVDAAEKRASAREEELWRQRYSDVIAQNLDAANIDVDAEVEAELAKARPHIKAAIDLLGARNAAISRITRYGADDANYREPDDGLMVASYHEKAPGVSMFTFRGRMYEFVPAARLLKQLIRPLGDVLTGQQGSGIGSEWLEEGLR